MACQPKRLESPPEPLELRAATRRLLTDAPTEGLRLLASGDWILDLLWEAWGTTLAAASWDRERLSRVIVGYSNELRLWVLGERPWEHCIGGLAGRVERRLPG